VLRGNVEVLARGTPGLTRQAEIFSRAWLARVLSALGEFAEGRCHGEAALRLTTEDGPRDPWMAAHGCLGLLHLAQGDLEAAVQVFDRGLALGRASGDRNWLPEIAGALGEAYARMGRLAEGLALLEEALMQDIHAGALFRQTTHVRRLSAVELVAGRLAEAWQHACQALDLARQQHARGEEALALFQLGTVHAHADPPELEPAEASYHQALTLADELGMRPLQAHCRLGLGTLYAKTGRRQQAHTELSAAITLYRGMDMTFWLPQAEATLAQLEGHNG
jgi:tetratricopeptide (TPR) repeat protein